MAIKASASITLTRVNDGSDGTSIHIVSQKVEYAVYYTGTTPPPAGWSETIPEVPNGLYLWTRTTVNYSDETSTISYSVSKYANNLVITSQSVMYGKSSSGTVRPGSWYTSVPSTTPGQYLWTRTIVTYSDGTSTTSYSVSRNGSNGADGKDAAIISSTPPSDTTMLWCDISVDPPVLKRYDGSKWIIVNDFTETANNLGLAISNLSTSIESTSEAVVLEALKTYTMNNDFNEFKTTVESQLKLLANSMTLQFTETQETLNKVNSDLQNQLNTITKYFTFNINGLTIGQVENQNKVVIDNDEIQIMVNDMPVLKFDANGKGTIPSLSITEALCMFDYTISRTFADGSTYLTDTINCDSDFITETVEWPHY